MRITKAAKRTEFLNRLHERLFSIAKRAIDAQSDLENPDVVFDCLDDVERDLQAARAFNENLRKEQ